MKSTNIYITFLSLTLSFFFIDFLKADSVKDNLGYHIVNYKIDDYNAGTQNWNTIRLEDGTICFANNKGLLVKNGNDWSLYETPSKDILRTLKESDTKIYVGGGSAFGYFQKELSGSYQYTSLSDKFDLNWGEIWNIEIHENKVYFQGGRAIYIFDLYEDTLVKEVNYDRIDYFKIAGKKILLQTASGGFFSTDLNLQNQEVLVDAKNMYDYVVRYTQYLGGHLYVFTLNSGIYKCEQNRLVPCSKSIQGITSYSQIYCGLQLGDYIVLGTVLDGIYILDKETNIVKHINLQLGLRNNTVLSLYSDDKQNIWAGLDNGISCIDFNSQLSPYKFNKEIGVGYASAQYGTYHYWGTNQGLYYTDSQHSLYDINLISNTQGQVWCLTQIGNKLYCGHHQGLFRVEQNRVIPTFNELGIMNIVRLGKNSDYYIVVSYYNRFLFKHNSTDDSFTKVSSLKNDLQITRNLKIDKNNWAWFTRQNDLVKFKIDTVSGQINEYKLYEMKDEKYVFSVNDDMLLWRKDSFYQYNADKDTFDRKDSITIDPKHRSDLVELIFHLPIEELHRHITNYTDIIGDLWLLKNQLQWNVQMASTYNGSYVVNNNEGFVNFDPKRYSTDELLPRIVISEIKIKHKESNEYTPITERKLSYDENSIRFKFNSNDGAHIVYQYKLIGFDEDFSVFTSKNTKEYTNLPEGTYRFEVRAKTMNGKASNSAYFEFEIEPPFYRTEVAKIIYLLLSLILIALLYLLVKYLIRRKERQMNELRLKEIEALEKIHKIEALSSENTIISLENKRLEESIMHKQREMSNTTRNVVVKNNLLLQIKEHLQGIYKEKNVEKRDEKLSKIFHLIDSNIDNKEDWDIFEKNFSELHAHFFANLQKDFPDISPTELKLCAYIKLNKSTKDIADLMNITTRGVETTRYRLRKKLGLERGENISSFLSKY